MTTQFRRSAYAVAALCLLGFSQVFLTNYLQNQRSELFKNSPPSHLAIHWNPQLISALSFSHLPMIVDLIWVRALQDGEISSHKVWPKGEHPWIYYDIDLVTKLDPAFFIAYFGGSNLLSIVRNDNAGAVEILSRGERFRVKELPVHYSSEFRDRFWSGRWYIPVMLAYIYLFELNDIQNASNAFLNASQAEGSPSYLKSLAQRIQQPGGVYELGLKLIRFMIVTTKDDRAKEELEKKQKSLYLAQFLFVANHDFEEFLKTMPTYRSDIAVQRSQLEKAWSSFLKKNRQYDRDPWGGRLSLSGSGKIVSSTPHEAVFGLE